MKKDLNLEFFQKLIGLKISKTWRLFHEELFEDLPKDFIDEESDGNLYILFSNGDFVCFYPSTELISIRYRYLDISCLPTDVREVTSNSFWKKRIENEIVEINYIYSDFSNKKNPIGFRIDLENSTYVKIMYVSESDCTFDALVIRGNG